MMGFSAINLAAILTKIIPALIFLLKHTKHMRQSNVTTAANAAYYLFPEIKNIRVRIISNIKVRMIMEYITIRGISLIKNT